MSTVALNLNDSIGFYPSGIDQQALRNQTYGAIALANESNVLTPDNIAQIEASWGLGGVEVPSLVRQRYGVTSGSMTCSFTESVLGGERVTIVFVQGNTGFKMTPQAHYKNQISYQQEFAQNWMNVQHSLAENIELQVIAAIDASKATTSQSSLVGAGLKYPLVGDALQVSLADQEFFFNDAKSIFFADDFGMQTLQVLGDANLMPHVMQYVNQGGQNATNTQFQFNGFQFRYSNSVTTTTATSARSTFYMMPQNSISMIGRTAQLYQAGYTSGSEEYSTIFSPILGTDLMVRFDSECADVSPTTGFGLDTASVIEKTQFQYDLAFIVPNDASTNSGTKKVDFLAV